MKYAKPQELPSFPSTGALADSAGKAALLAKDYKMKELWQPEQSLAGSKAAVMAAGKGGKLDLWQASATPEGHSAATLAMRNKGLSPHAYTGVDADNRSKALLAATKSHNQGRKRAGSTPTPAAPAYPDSQNATRNALNAATVSHSTSVRNPMKGMGPDGWSSEAMQAARIKNVGTHMGGVEQWGEHPTVEIPGESAEAKHQAALRASAVSMAKTLYETQNRTALTDDPEEIAARAAAGRNSTSSQGDIKQEAMRYINLQEAAHKLASERLAKVDKNFENSRFREYYGYEDKPKRLSSRMSMRSVGGGRQRRRASSDGTGRYDDSDDEEQARRIRKQMSQLSAGMGQVNQKKQQDDRAKLLAAAEKRVTANMHTMDERVYAQTGKIPPALQEEWEAKARERAQKERELQAQNPGKTHIGGGKFMEQSEIDAIAAARLKPTLDEIADNAEQRRARDEELRQEKEEQERVKREEKAQKKEEKDEQKRIKSEYICEAVECHRTNESVDEQKAEAKQQKDEEKARKAEEKARQAEEKRIAKEEKRKSKEQSREEATAGVAGVAAGEDADKAKDDTEAGDDAAYQKHRSALSRLKERFRRSHVPEGEAAEDSEEKSGNKAAVAGVAGGAATGAALGEVAEHKNEGEPDVLDSQQATHAVSHDDEAHHPDPANPMGTGPKDDEAAADVPEQKSTRDVHHVDKWNPEPAAAAPAAVPTIVTDDGADAEADDEFDESEDKPERPRFEQQPSLVGYGNDRSPESTKAMPNLERHISQIPDSDDGESSGEDWNDDKVEREHTHDVAERVIAAPVVDRSAAAPVPTDVQTDESRSRMDDQRAEPPKDLPASMEAPGVPKPDTETAEAQEKMLETDPAHKDHSILRQIINPHGKKHDEQAFGDNAQEVPASEAKTSTEEKPKPSKLQKTTSPVAATESKSPTSPSSADRDEKQRKGLRGLLGKFGSKKDKKSKYPDFKSVGKDSKDSKDAKESSSVPYESTKAGDKPATSASATAADAKNKSAEHEDAASPSLPQVDAGPSLTEDSTAAEGGVIGKRDDSPSSFKRGENELKDLDDVSSSGAEEEDVSRGRGGRIAHKLGFGNSRTTRDDKGKAPAKDEDRKNSGTEDEQFEEARDHFDETLAPPPAFAGQQKSESPVRGTKFQEEF